MVDSSVGGKTAVDPTAENMVGAFASLPGPLRPTRSNASAGKYACSCAEVIKYAMIESEDFPKPGRKPISEQAEG